MGAARLLTRVFLRALTAAATPDGPARAAVSLANRAGSSVTAVLPVDGGIATT